MIEGRGHERYRELISAQLDSGLNVIEEGQLARHLRSCTACRRVQHDFADQRNLLRGMARRQPPRDLWARTSAALDREVARRRWSPPPDGPRRRLLPRVALAGTASALGIALVLGSTQLGLAPTTPPGTPAALLPTPFAIAPQPIAFVGAHASGMVIYRAQLDQVCPTSALGCLTEDDIAPPQLINLPGTGSPANLTLSPDGERLVLTARTSGRDGVYAVRLDDSGPGISDRPTVAPTTPSAPPSPSEPTVPPPPTEPTAEASPSIATPPAAHPTPAYPIDIPNATAPTSPEPPAAASPEPPAATFTPAGTPEPTPSETAAALAAVTVMDDVRVAGAPPAWSADGNVLAFSAMPADGSRGPDVYVWHDGDAAAQPLSDDNATYFASWSGERIVASRVVRDEGEAAIIRTVVIDPRSGAERELALDSVWLPQLSPAGERAVVWRGELRATATEVRPISGDLFLADWSLIDASPEPARLGADEEADQEPTSRPDESAATAAPADEAAPSGRPAETPAGEPTAEPRPATDEPAFVELDRRRDASRGAVLDWHVRWSNDGSIVGYWVADAVGASWGRLTVVAVGSNRDGAVVGEPVLEPTLARRSFTLGPDRVAWIAPADASLEGEVRIRTWGPGGAGGLRLPTLDLREVVPAF